MTNDWLTARVALSPHQKHMQRIMTQCFFAVKSKLDRRLGLFDLIGCDFMVDEDFKVGGAVLANALMAGQCPNVCINRCLHVAPTGVAVGNEL